MCDNIVQNICNMLKQCNKTVATAESCTGGYLSHLLTSISGSSSYFCGSIVAYQPQCKVELLQVNPQTIAKYTLVSKQVATEMAQGTRKCFNADIGLATTGIAESDAEINDIWVGLADKFGSSAELLKVTGSRVSNIKSASLRAMNILSDRLCLLHNQNTCQV